MAVRRRRHCLPVYRTRLAAVGSLGGFAGQSTWEMFSLQVPQRLAAHEVLLQDGCFGLIRRLALVGFFRFRLLFVLFGYPAPLSRTFGTT